MNYYCTLFDSHYFTRGLAMYRSLVATGELFTLFIYCFDTFTFELLTEMRLPNVKPISLEEFETEELKKVKPLRTKAEYCWTCTSHTIRHALDTYQLPEVTYLDADLFFYAPPSILLEEFHRAVASVLLTEHRYTSRYDHSRTSGIYCVQFITFRSDDRGLTALQWWQERCIEWCYAREEDGKFGDQKYLDDWPARFPGIYVLKHLGGGVAPWNVQQYSIQSDKSGLRVNEHPLIFYHFHHYKYFPEGMHDFSHYRLVPEVIDLIYIPYASALLKAEQDVKTLRSGFSSSYSRRSWRYSLSIILRRLRGTYNVHRFAKV
jgi:hypothetical protein